MKKLKLFYLILAVPVIFWSCQEEDPTSLCPDVLFTIDIDSADFSYSITAEGIEELIYSWKVNDKIIETEELNEERDNIFDFRLEPGTYNICITAESEECDEIIEFCQEVTILGEEEFERCIGLHYEYARITDLVYVFEAEFEGMNEVLYTWYVDGDSIKTEALDAERTHRFEYEFTEGEHEVCIVSSNDECGEEAYCKTILAGAERCPELSFEVAQESENLFIFTSNFEGLEEVSYKWFINEEEVDKENFDDVDTDHKLIWDFETGEYHVCIVADIDGCGEIVFCKEIRVIPDNCPDLSFTKTEEGKNTYLFTADFEGKEEVSYMWYINDDLVDKENFEGTETDHKLFWQFDPGQYHVCMVVPTDECAEVEYCMEIVIDHPTCPTELFFEKEKEGDNGYLFFARFEGLETVPYKWYVNDEIVDMENFDGNETDHKLFWDFEPGEYHVCIKSFVDGCESVEYCETISIEGVQCPSEVFFNVVEEGDNLFLFSSDFVGMEEIPYKWYINDEIVDKENFDGYENDHKLLWDFGPGTYNVCIETYYDACEPVYYCHEIVIDQVCPTEVYFATQDKGDNLYLFTADFEGKSDIPYKWYINDEIVDKENFDGYENDHQLLWDFEPGTYDICIVTDIDGCESVEFCEQLVIEEQGTTCVDISFTAVKDENAPAYTFTADFTGKDDVTYIWAVYINDDYQGGEVREAGSTDDHEFYWQFESGVQYEVCLKQDGGCIDKQVCEVFSVE